MFNQVSDPASLPTTELVSSIAKLINSEMNKQNSPVDVNNNSDFSNAIVDATAEKLADKLFVFVTGSDSKLTGKNPSNSKPVN